MCLTGEKGIPGGGNSWSKAPKQEGLGSRSGVWEEEKGEEVKEEAEAISHKTL